MKLDAPPERPLPLRIADVFREHAPFAWRVLRRLGVAEADVNDVCQDVFMVVHRKLPDFEGRSSVRTWVYGICVRVAADHRKAAKRLREVPGEDAAEAAIEPGQERAVHLREATAMLDRILDGVDDEKRAVFVLYEIEELGMQEVATALGCPLQTAYSRLHAARREVEAGAQRLLAKGGTR
jgi:RNA polymerase sigma-70 factor (ECF subfamily)